MRDFQKASACVSLEGSFADIANSEFFLNPDRQVLTWALPRELLSLGPEWSQAVTSRRQEFCAGRACAALALNHLGSADLSVGRAQDRRPIWPRGFVGSISHTRDFAIALVASNDFASSVGVDAERTVSRLLRLEIEERVLSVNERSRAPDSLSPEEFFSCAFAAKEAVYKALNPLDNVYRDFRDLHLRELSPSGLFKVFDTKSTQMLSGTWKKFADLFVCETRLVIEESSRIIDVF
jgi:enterobactin synthetase component D